jgi:hypothetical protein
VKVRNLEDKVVCPIEGCDSETAARGLHLHIYHTDDPEGEGHYPRGEVPPDFNKDNIEVIGKQSIQMDYPDEQELEDAKYLDTYTGKAYKGKRGLMIHLGQMEGQENIPSNVTDRHDADDFPMVKVDEKGNITDVLRWSSGDVPAIEPYLPWYEDRDKGFIERRKVKELVKELKNGSGAISAEVLEEELLGSENDDEDEVEIEI